MHGDPINSELSDMTHSLVLDYCRSRRVTQEMLAHRLGLPAGTLSNFLTGARPLPASVVVRLVVETGDGRLLTAMSDLAGIGVRHAESCEGLRSQTRRAHRGSFEAIDRIIGAVEDNHICSRDLKESKHLLRAAREELRVLEASVEAVHLMQQRKGNGSQANTLAEAEQLRE